MRVVFMGTPEFALPTLERLIASRHEVVAVVTQPDRPAGRGREIAPPPVKKRAVEAAIPVLQPERVRGTGFRDELASLHPDVAVVVAYGKILPPDILDVPRHGCFNVHASLLPRYRGAAPIQRAIANCDRETGVTIMKLDEGMDTGPTVCAEEIEILDDDDALSVANMLSVLGAELMMQTLETLDARGSVPLTPQDSSQATYAPPIKKEEGRIDWNQPTDTLICLLRAMHPWPGAYTTFRSREWKILQGQPFELEPGTLYVPPPEVEPGTVVALVKTRGFAVRTRDGALLVTRVQLPGKKPIEAGALLNARLLAEGDQLG